MYASAINGASVKLLAKCVKETRKPTATLKNFPFVESKHESTAPGKCPRVRTWRIEDRSHHHTHMHTTIHICILFVRLKYSAKG